MLNSNGLSSCIFRGGWNTCKDKNKTQRVTETSWAKYNKQREKKKNFAMNFVQQICVKIRRSRRRMCNVSCPVCLLESVSLSTCLELQKQNLSTWQKPNFQFFFSFHLLPREHLYFALLLHFTAAKLEKNFQQKIKPRTITTKYA